MVVECLLAKNENQYLCEHIVTNMLAGIDFFYIFDNYSDVPVSDFLSATDAKLLNYCRVERFQGYGGILQLDCYNHFISEHADSSDYVAFVDVDELFEGDLKAAINHYCDERITSIRIASILHGCAGHVFDDGSNTLASRFRRDILRMKDWTKTISRIDVIKRIAVHNAYLKFPHTQISIDCDNCDVVQLHHYRFRSFEEYVKKIIRGSCDERARFDVQSFFDYNLGVSASDKDVQSVMARYNVNLFTCQI